MSFMKLRVFCLVILVICVSGVLTTTGSLALELPDNSAFLQTELLVIGTSTSSLWPSSAASAGLALDQIGGDGMNQPDEFGGGTKDDEEEEVDDDGSSNTGSKVKAGLFSAILPGAGQYYNGDPRAGIEVAGKKVPTSPLSSRVKALEIADTLKQWILDKKFELGEPVAHIPSVDYSIDIKE